MVLHERHNGTFYHFLAFVDEILLDKKTGGTQVKWSFPNGHKVELVFKTMDEAVLKYMSPEIILPEEGIDGHFYTSREILLFLTRIKEL